MTSVAMAEQLLIAARAREDVRVVALCDAANPPPRGEPARVVHGVGRELLKRLFDPRHELVLGRGDFLTLEGVARRHRVPLLRPEQGDINEPAFIAQLAGPQAIGATLAIGCAQKFGAGLLGTIRLAANYHNGLLPAYAGTRATRWSMYHREPVTGFTFHYMTDRLDAGRVLIQGQVPLTPGVRAEVLEAAKTQVAVRALPLLLDKLVRGDAGVPQLGERTYFGARELHTIQNIEQPQQLDCAELLHRLHCFDLLRLRIDGTVHAVTQLCPARAAGHRTFMTRDGVLLAATRFNYLPWGLNRLRRAR